MRWCSSSDRHLPPRADKKFDPFPPIRQRNSDLILLIQPANPRPSSSSCAEDNTNAHSCLSRRERTDLTTWCSFAAHNPFGRVATSALGDLHAANHHIPRHPLRKMPNRSISELHSSEHFLLHFPTRYKNPSHWEVPHSALRLRWPAQCICCVIAVDTSSGLLGVHERIMQRMSFASAAAGQQRHQKSNSTAAGHGQSFFFPLTPDALLCVVIPPSCRGPRASKHRASSSCRVLSQPD